MKFLVFSGELGIDKKWEASGANGFIPKPSTMQEIINSIKAIIG